MRGVWANLKRVILEPVVVVSVSVLAAFLVVAGPFGSYVSMTLAQRLVFWVPVALAGSVLGLVIDILVVNWMGRENERRAGFVTALISALVLSLPLFALINRFIAAARSDLSCLFETVLLIFFANLGICSLRKAWKDPPPAESAPLSIPVPVPIPVPIPLPPFVSRLPVEIQARVALITGRNHHIDIETDLGSAALFMRFSDAVLQMPPAEGMQVHRSHWVAFRRMRGIEKTGQRHFLVLDGEVRVPISRNHVDSLRQRMDLPQIGEMPQPISQAAE